MNKPKVNMGYSQEIIDKCALLAPKEMCEFCVTTLEECVDCQKETKEEYEKNG
jgi:hypothetical protein